MRILLIEDEPEIAKFIEQGLERARYVVDYVDDGRMGVYQAAVNPYDLILCDYMLPLKDGISLVAELRAKQIDTPVLMLTVVDDLDTMVRALDSGADDYLCKPFPIEELLARVRALLRREKSWQGDQLQVGDILLDSKHHKVERAGVTITLTRKEYMLLEYLMRHADEIVTRTNILEHVWDSAADPFSNSVEVHVRFLRRKIEDPFVKSGRVIHTVHGVGYRLTTLPQTQATLSKP